MGILALRFVRYSKNRIKISKPKQKNNKKKLEKHKIISSCFFFNTPSREVPLQDSFRLLVYNTAVLLDPIQVGGDSGENGWVALLTAQSQTKGSGTD